MACRDRDPVGPAFRDPRSRATSSHLVRCARWIPRGLYVPSRFLSALFVQAISVGVAFLVFGTAIGKKIMRVRFSHAVWVVNPVTVGVGFAAYKGIYHSLRLPDYLPEYDSLNIFALFVIAAPVVFAFCLFAGASLRGLHRGPVASE